MTKDRMVVKVEDVSDDAELKEKVGVGGVTPSNVKIQKTIRQEE